MFSPSIFFISRPDDDEPQSNSYFYPVPQTPTYNQQLADCASSAYLLPQKSRYQNADPSLNQSLSQSYWQSSNPNQTQASCSYINLNRYNNLAIFLHFVNAITVFVLSATYLADKPENIVFVSGKIELTQTNYAVIDINTKKTCPDVKEYSDIYQNKILKNDTSSLHIIDSDIVPHSLYDFTNKTIVKYNNPSYSVHTYYLIASFFLLSFLFQAFNGIFIGFKGQFPRIMHYIEYSMSSSLMVIVLAINVGILELYTLLAFFFLFFAMNILGACAEIISWMTAVLFQNRSMRYGWLIPHISAWFIYIFTYTIVIFSYEKVRDCSAGVPDFVTAAIYVEFFFFCLFGITQTALLFWRTSNPSANVTYWMDFMSITLSILAKTFLAWILISPVLSSS